MEKYYFTFGSAKQFPHKNTYMVIASSGYRDAIREFRERYPDVNPDCLNCSDYYSEEEWKRVGKYYADQSPAEIIFTNTCFGEKPEGYDDLFIFVPEMKEIIRIAEGTGGNLNYKDYEEGCVDYIYYEQYELDQDMSKFDGGQILLEEMFREKYKCTADCIPDVLDMAYGNNLLNCSILA